MDFYTNASVGEGEGPFSLLWLPDDLRGSEDFLMPSFPQY